MAVRPPDDRLHGRLQGHTLRPRQQELLDTLLPRLRYPLGLAPDAAFGHTPARLAVEIGFGGGEHAHALVLADPALSLIACEVFEPGLCSMLSRLTPDSVTPPPSNIRLWDDDARILLRALPAECLDAAFLMFPDPWPKSRHAKRRFVHPGQVPLVARVIRAGGVWRVATDDPTYQAWVQEVMAMQSLFDAPPPATERPDGWPPTRYEAKAILAGRHPLYWTFTRTKTACPAA